MMKNLKKGFTLVEILIVIVIIGILIAALIPRMSAAQGRARDVARKNDLSNLQAAIVVAYQDLGRYPCTIYSTTVKGCNSGSETSDSTAKDAAKGIAIKELKTILEAAGMNSVPKDPLLTNKFYGLGTGESDDGEYMYITLKSNGIDNGGFAVMAKTEVAGGSNWVVCGTGAGNDKGFIGTNITTNDNNKDVKKIHLCDSITKSGTCYNNAAGTCTYKDESDLRYVMVY